MTETSRYSVLQMSPSGTDVMVVTNDLGDAMRTAILSPSYELFDNENGVFVPLACDVCAKPLERNPITGDATCFLHLQQYELPAINNIRASLGSPPLTHGGTRPWHMLATERGCTDPAA